MVNVGNPEILQIADAVSREKTISRESVLDAMEQAIQVAGRRKYGHKHNIKAKIDRKTGEIKLYRLYEVIDSEENIVNPITQVTIEEARNFNKDIVVGEFIEEELPPIDLGRVAAQAAKQVIVQKVRDVERERQFQDFQSRVGEIVNGIVKRNEYGNIIVDIGRDEAVLIKDKVIPGEVFRQNDRIRVFVEDVKRVSKGPQIFLSRTADAFLVKLFAQEVPEVYDRVISVKAVAREPGSRAKMAVYCSDSSIDPVGSCVGVRGVRVQAVISELHGEKIDIIQWSSDPGTLVVNALAPAEVTKVVIDEDMGRIEVVVPTEQLSIAIGKKGQNVRLAGKLTGWKIDVLTEEEESKRRSEEFTNSTKLFMEALDVEEVIAQLLAAEGYSKVEEIAYVELDELKSIEGFDDELVEELRNRAMKYVDRKNIDNYKKIKELGVDESVIKLLNLPPHLVLKLAESGVKKNEDLAELNVQEFIQIVPQSNLTEAEIVNILDRSKLIEKDNN